MGRVSLRVLGPVVAEVDGRSAELGSPQQRAVLACLAMQPGAVIAATALIDRLWPDDPPATAAKLVQKHVSGLRSALGSDTIETTGGGYRLTIDPVDIDAVRFERSIGDPTLAEAAELNWRGAPYSGCGELPAVLAERERLSRVRLEAQLDRLDATIERGAFASSLADLERLAVDHPEHERIVMLLMRGLYASDRHVEALRAFRRHERHLREDLGVDPSPELAELEGRILRHDGSLRIERATPTVRDTATSDAPAADAPTEEIRPVVVVLASESSPELTPDDLRVRQRVFAERVAELAERFGGHNERSNGGESIVLFGIPAHDDDLARAAALGEALADAHPSARIAVVSGDAVVAVEPRPALLADTLVDRARRLATEAAPGRVTSESVTDGAIDPAESIDGDVVGRDRELDVAIAVWQRVVGDGRLRVVEMIGEAGIGKSRLARETIDRLRPPPHRVVEFGLSALGDRTALSAFRGALEQLVNAEAGLDTWLSTLDLTDLARRRLAARLEPLLDGTGGTGPDSPDEWTTTMVQVCGAVAAAGPLVIVIEDAHWAQTELVDRLRDALLDLAERPVLVLVTRRPEPSSNDLRAPGIAEHASLRLEALDPAAATHLGNDIGGDLPAASRALAVERSEGNPLFLLHYVRMLRERNDASSTAPDTIRLVISARLDHLSTALRSVIQAAALVPNRVSASVIATLTDRGDRDTGADLAVLARAGLLRRAGREGVGWPAYTFQHALVAEVARGQLTRPRRIELHQRAAATLDSADHDSLDDVEEAAWHWTQVLDLSDTEGVGVDASSQAAAREALGRAVSRTRHVDAPQSIRLLRRALTLADDGTADRAHLLLQLGAIATDAGDLDDACTVLAQAATIYEELGDGARSGEALARQARALWYLGRGDDIDRLLERSFTQLAGAPPSPSHAHANVVAVTQTAIRGRPTEALEIADRIESVVRQHGTAEDSIRMLHARGHARFDLDDAGGVTELEESLRRSLDGGFGRLASQSYNNLAEVVWFVRGPNEAVQLAGDGLDLALESGYLGQAPWHIAQVCELSYDVGDWDAAAGAAARPHEYRMTPVAEWVMKALRARVEFWRGDDQALTDLDDVLRSARSTHELQVVVPMLSAAIAAHAALGAVDVAASLGAELVTFARDGGHHRLRDAGDAVRGLCRAGRADLARELIPDVRPEVLRRALMWDSAMARIAEAHEQWSDAARHHARAEAEWSAFPHPFEAAHAAAGSARAARALGASAADVEAHTIRAHAGFARLGADRCLAELTANDDRG